MIGSGVLSVRLGGIFALQSLAKERPEDYHIQIMRLLCAYLCHPTLDDRFEEKLADEEGKLRDDVQAVMDVIREREPSAIGLEQRFGFIVDLRNANLSHGRLNEAFLRRAILANADLSFTFLDGANLSDAILWRAKLHRTKLADANLTGTDMSGLDFGTSPEPVTGLTQAQLDQARADPNNPPDLRGVLDAETGQPLVWTEGQGAPLKDDE